MRTNLVESPDYLSPALRELRKEALRHADDLGGSLADRPELDSQSRHEDRPERPSSRASSGWRAGCSAA